LARFVVKVALFCSKYGAIVAQFIELRHSNGAVS
jgi:hypothetical protein